MKFFYVALILGILQTNAIADSQGYYSIIAPGTIHPNSHYNVAVSTQQILEPCKIVLGLEGPNFEKKIEVDVQPMISKNVEFFIPDVKSGDWKLSAEGLSGLIFKNSTELKFDDNTPSVYIQTDKATYKPGDLIQFRVLILDENTRPAKINKPTTVFIKDAANNRVKQFSNITLPKGVFTGKMQLSEFPLLGPWTIEVQINGASVYKKNFDVSKYVLPKFQVMIDAPKKISVLDETFGFTVRSKYTFGKLVNGKTTVTVNSHKLADLESSFSVGQNYPGVHLYPTPMPSYPRGGVIPRFDVSLNPYWNPASPHRETLDYRPGNVWIPQPANRWNNRPVGWRGVTSLTKEKTIESNGKAFVEFKIKELLPDGIGNGIPNTLKIFVETEEELTGKKQNASTDIEVVQNRFHIDAPNLVVKCINSDEKFNYSVAITNVQDEPVSDQEHVVSFESVSDLGETLGKQTAYLNNSGIASISLECNKNKNSRIIVSYQGQLSYGSVTTENDEKSETDIPVSRLMAKIPSNLKLGKDIEIKVQSPEPMQYFVYTIIARGNIIKSELIQLPEGGSKSHTFHLKPSFEMMPTAKLYIYYIQDSNFKFHETSFSVQKGFSNSISITAPPQTVPGGEIAMKVRTDMDSYVGLMGVDQSVLLLKSGNDFDSEAILRGVENYKTETPSTFTGTVFGKEYPGAKSGVVTMTNGQYPYEKRQIYPYYHSPVPIGAGYMPQPYGVSGGASSYSRGPGMPGTPGMLAMGSMSGSWPQQKTQPPPQVRKRFLETWFFEDIDGLNNENAILKKQLPDTITSWVVTGFSLNPETGFAITKAPTTIKTFKPFFLSTNLPYSIKRGEQVTIPVILFNYMEEPLTAEVTLKNEDDEFEFTEAGSDNTKQVKTITVDPNNGETIMFAVRPKKLGYISLKITAISPLAGDAIDKKLKVEPEGITVYKNRDYYLQTEQNGPEINDNITLDIPNDIVPDSEHIEVSVMGDILGSTISNLDQLVRMPSGCGEQNMVNFVPNILVLRYLESTNQLSPAIEEKAKKYLEIGYQRELTYRHDNGSYSAFGKSDKSGSTWLTAYVMRSFHQASKYIDIDQKVLSQGLNFLADIQAPNGSFPEIGKVLDFSHYNDVGLTAFVLLAFLENDEQVPRYKNTIERGFKYLEEHVKNTDDLYAASIAVYALQIHKSSVVPEILSKLDVQAKLDGGLKWWTKSVDESRSDQAWRPKSHDVEVTGYILMTLLEKNEGVLPITKWLLTQRNSNGGFSSTQETVVGLQALIKFAEKTGGGETNLKINVASTDANTSPKEFVVNPDNTLIMQTLELQNQARQIKFAAKGKGAAILQISYRYNIIQKEDKPSFNLNVKLKENSKPNKLSMEVCAEFVPLENTKESNMVVMEVSLPSGYVADKDAFNRLNEVEDVKLVETKKSDTNIVVYLDGLESTKERCMPIEAELAHDVKGQKPVPVVIYDYYDSQKRASEFYQISDSSTTKEV